MLAQRDGELTMLEARAEALIGRATCLGADVDFYNVRRAIALGRRYRMPRMFDDAIAALETGIAAANRERMRRSSRRPFVVKVKNLLKL